MPTQAREPEGRVPILIAHVKVHRRRLERPLRLEERADDRRVPSKARGVQGSLAKPILHAHASAAPEERAHRHHVPELGRMQQRPVELLELTDHRLSLRGLLLPRRVPYRPCSSALAVPKVHERLQHRVVARRTRRAHHPCRPAPSELAVHKVHQRLRHQAAERRARSAPATKAELQLPFGKPARALALPLHELRALDGDLRPRAEAARPLEADEVVLNEAHPAKLAHEPGALHAQRDPQAHGTRERAAAHVPLAKDEIQAVPKEKVLLGH